MSIVRSLVHNDEFRMRETHRIASRPDHQIVTSSEDLGWRNVYAVVQRERPYEGYLEGINDHFFVFHLKGSVGIHWSMDNRDLSGLVTPGRYDYFPGRENVRVKLDGEIETMHLYLRSNLVEAVSAEMAGSGGAARLAPVFNGSDLFLEQIGVSIRGVLNEPSSTGALYVEELSWALAAHLVHSSGRRGAAVAPQVGGLSKQQIRRVIEFIGGHLEQRINLSDLASAACLSPVYFSRRFKRAMQMSPHQFVTQCRVDRARHLLGSTTLSIAEIAARCGFCHQEHMTRVLRARCGITPAAYRKTRAS